MALSTLIARDAHFIFVLRDAIPSKRDSKNNMEKERKFTIRLILTRSQTTDFNKSDAFSLRKLQTM